MVHCFALIFFQLGEKVIVQVEHPKSDGNLECVLPLTLKVKVERQGGKREIPEIFLSKSNVISPTRNVKIMEMDTAGYVRTHHHEIQELEVRPCSSSNHFNHSHVMALKHFTISITWH